MLLNDALASSTASATTATTTTSSSTTTIASTAYFGLIGVALNQLTLAAMTGTVPPPVAQGILVTSVIPGGPASRAGIRGGSAVYKPGLDFLVGGDVVTAANGVPLTSPSELQLIAAQHRPGYRVRLTVISGSGVRRSVVVTLGVVDSAAVARTEKQALRSIGW